MDDFLGKEKMTKYEVAMNDNVLSLEDDVREMIDDGWKPQGGICVNGIDDDEYYYQAMIKEE